MIEIVRSGIFYTQKLIKKFLNSFIITTVILVQHEKIK